MLGDLKDEALKKRTKDFQKLVYQGLSRFFSRAYVVITVVFFRVIDRGVKLRIREEVEEEIVGKPFAKREVRGENEGFYVFIVMRKPDFSRLIPVEDFILIILKKMSFF